MDKMNFNMASEFWAVCGCRSVTDGGPLEKPSYHFFLSVGFCSALEIIYVHSNLIYFVFASLVFIGDAVVAVQNNLDHRMTPPTSVTRGTLICHRV